MTKQSTDGYAPARTDPDTAMIPIEIPEKSRTENVLEAPEVDPATATVENYCLLIQRLIIEVEAEGYSIGHDMRCRIRDDVIHTHKRETRLLRAIYGHTELKNKMRGGSWRLAEMSEEEIEEGEQLKQEQGMQSSSGAIFGPLGTSDPKCLHPNTSHSSQDDVEDVERPPENDHTATMDLAHASELYPPINLFLNSRSRDEPWNDLNLFHKAPKVEEPRVAGEKGWLPAWVPGASRLGLHNILPLNPLKWNTQSEQMPDMPYLRSGTSMLVTEESHDMETIASSEDLAALTDSTDTETFVSAQSSIGESVLDSQHPFLVEGEKQGPLVILGDDEYSEPEAKDCGRLGIANLYPSLGELLAAWINPT